MKVLSLCLLFLGITLSGCLKSLTVLHIQPDGKATLEETLLMSKSYMGMMSQDSMNDETRRQKLNEMFAEGGMSDVSQARLVRVEPLNDSAYMGMKFYYVIDSLNGMNIKSSSRSANPMTGGGEEESSSKKSKGTLFRFTKATTSQPAVLSVIDLDSLDKKESATAKKNEKTAKSPKKKKKKEMEQDSASNQFAMAMMEGMMEAMGDMRMDMMVDVQGTIVSTNATRKEGNNIIFGNIDFGVFKKDWKKNFSKDMMAQLANPTSVLKDPKNALPGIFVEPKPVVTIQFK